MCSILITKDWSMSSHKALSDKLKMRGLTHRTDTYNNIVITHHRLPLQEKSEEQPVEYEDDFYYMIGEYYEKYDGHEVIELYKRIARNIDWLCDWEGTIIKFNPTEKYFLILVDPLRKRPLFYFKNKGRFVIANDFSIFKYVQKEVDPINLGITQRNGFCDDESTPLRGVIALEPGIHEIRLTDGNHTHLKMPDYLFKPSLMKNYDTVIEKSVKNRIKKESLSKFTGTYLSGGIDSTILHTLIDRFGEFEKKIPAIILDNLCSDQEKRNIDWLNRNTSSFEFFYDDFEDKITNDEIHDIMKWFSWPIDLGSVVPQIQLTQATVEARRLHPNLFVILTGDGADEFFGGYKRNFKYDSRWYDIFVELPYYHNLRLDQIPFKKTIEIRTPFQALPLINLVLNMSYSNRINKKLFRELGCEFGIPVECMEIKKYPLKTIPEDDVMYRKELITAFRMEVSESGIIKH